MFCKGVIPLKTISDKIKGAVFIAIVLFLGVKSSTGMALHTVREIKNITKEELEMIMKGVK